MKIALEAYLYEPQKKGDVKRMRMEGKIPGVLYGHKEKSKRIYVLKKEFEKILETLKRETVTIELKLKDKTYSCLIKAIQHNPIDGRLLHIDFQHISKKEKIKATIPIHLIGEAPGVKKGGLLDQHLHEVVVRCLPEHIPPHIDVDISKLDVGKTIHLRDIAIPNIEFEIKPETPIVSILAPRVEKVAPAPAGAPAEGPKEEAKEEVKEEKSKEEKAKEEKPAKESHKEK